MPDVLFVCPTYDEARLHRYTRRAVRSFLRNTPGGRVAVVDDASEGPDVGRLFDDLAALAPADGLVHVRRLPGWGGLTRSWNAGLALARDLGCEYALCSNNDVAFPARWYEGLVEALAAGYSLAGPVSNAPGITSRGAAEVWRYLPGYELSDEPAYLDAVSGRLLSDWAGRVHEVPVNGFAMLARTADWWSGAYDRDHVFRPRNDLNSKGHRNPTPLMTCNEDELQGRWERLGRRPAVALSSFVFHYRSVARGERAAKNRWLRVADPDRFP